MSTGVRSLAARPARPSAPAAPLKGLGMAVAVALAMAVSLMAAQYLMLDRDALVRARQDVHRLVQGELPRLAQLSPAARAAAVRSRATAASLNLTEAVALLDARGAPLAGPPVTPRDPEQGDRVRIGGADGVGLFVGLSGGQQLFVGVRTAAYRQRIWDSWLVISIAAALTAGPVLAWTVFAQRRLQRRLKDLEAACEQIGRGDLKGRLPVQGSGDELDGIAGLTNRMVERLERIIGALKMQSAFVGHEFGNAAGRLQAHVKVLRAMEDRLAAPGRAALASIDNEQQALTGSVVRIMELSATHARPLSVGPVDLAEVTAMVVEMHAPTGDEKDVTIDLRTETVEIASDRDALMLVLTNLIGNAVKFTPVGGRVAVACVAQPGGARLTIDDSGPGVAPQDRDRVFEPGGRVGGRDGPAGFGLGLTLVREEVGRLGGTVGVSDSSLGGACFTLVLPSTPP